MPMVSQCPVRIKLLGPGEVAMINAMLAMFGEAFGEVATYGALGRAIAGKKIRATVAGRAHFRPLRWWLEASF
jgi:hypothetical protein